MCEGMIDREFAEVGKTGKLVIQSRGCRRAGAQKKDARWEMGFASRKFQFGDAVWGTRSKGEIARRVYGDCGKDIGGSVSDVEDVDVDVVTMSVVRVVREFVKKSGASTKVPSVRYYSPHYFLQ